MIDFDNDDHLMRSMGAGIPEHTQETLEGYLLHGWEPGGFVTAMLACDLERALYTADVGNRQRFWSIAMWIRNYAPQGSWGSYEAVDAWCKNHNGCREKYCNEIEKLFVVKTLSKELNEK